MPTASRAELRRAAFRIPPERHPTAPRAGAALLAALAAAPPHPALWVWLPPALVPRHSGRGRAA